MKSHLLLLCSLVLSANSFAQSAAGASTDTPWITDTFPPANDVRLPDRTLEGVEKGPVNVLVYSPEGRFLATAGRDKVIRIWDARTGEQGTGKLVRTLEGHTGEILAIAFMGSSNSLESISADGTIRKWDLADGKSTSEPSSLPEGAKNLVIASGDKSILGYSDGPKAGYNLSLTNAAFFVESKPPISVTFTPDGKRFFAGDATGLVLWREVGGAGQPDHFSIDRPIRSLAATDTYLAVGSAEGLLQLRQTNGVFRDFPAHKGAVTAVAFSPNGEQVASAGADGLVKVWDVVTGTLLCSQTGHSSDAVSVAFNPNGQKMASGDAKGNVNYWTVPLPPIPPADLLRIKEALPEKATATPKKPRRILVFWRADAILHKGGVPAANQAIELMGKRTGAYEADFSREYAALDPKILARYDAIVLNSTAHLVMPEKAKQAYLDFVKRGGGVVGIHAAMDTFHDWPEGAQVIGATFGNHPWGPGGTWAVKLEGPEHPLLRAFNGKNFRIKDEFYEMGDPFTRDDRRVLLSVDLSDETTAGVKGLRRKDKDFALSWIKRYGEGRVFYCVFGHIAGPFGDRAVLQYYLDGIQYVLGDLEADATPVK